MSEFKGTPGPWAFATSQTGWSYTIHVHQAEDAPYTPDYSDVGYIIQTCKGERQDVQEANARLIASAPDLLAACQVVDRLDPHKDSTTDWNEAFKAVHGAVVKALGEQV